jgi:sulfatase maturation enzyme AslB (radical SAM superfamily)
MLVSSLPRKVARGLPYLGKEVRAIVSDHSPLFMAVPRTVHMWRGAPCNAKCIMCTYGYFAGEAYRQLISSDFTDEMMVRALDQIAELCGRGTLVSYMGGEPTTSRHIVEWIEQAGRLGLDFRFTTNGYIMTEEMARRFVAARLFNVGISLESLDSKINELIRPYPNGTARTLRCIDLLLQERERQKRHVSLNIKTVLTDVNLESFPEIVRRFGKLDGVMCTPQIFEPLQDMPPATKQLLAIKDISRLRRLTDEIRRFKSEGYTIHITEQGLNEIVRQCEENSGLTETMHGKKLEMDPSEPECNIGTDNLWIEHGLVKLCPYHAPIGNFVTDTHVTLKQMWESEITRRVRAQTRACRRLCTISCLRRTPIMHKVSTFMKIG